LERLEAVVAELHGRLTLGEAAPAAALVLAELRLLRQEHLVVSLLLLRRVLGLLLRRGAVRRVGDGRRSRGDLRLDRRLLAPLRRGGLLVGAGALDVVLAARAVARCTAAAPSASAAGAAATAAPATARRTHGAETLAVALAVASALAGRAEPFDVRTAA